MDAKTLALYLGCEFEFQERDDLKVIKTLECIDSLTVKMAERGWLKPILRPLSSMTEEDFKEFARDFYGSNNLVFASQNKYWYACERQLDPDYEGTPMEYINDAGDDDPENVLMCSTISKLITYGWITYDELYHGFSMKEQAQVIKFLLSKGFDLFGLIEKGEAIEDKP